MFITKEVNNAGVFAVKLRKNGEEQYVVVDNFIPCYEGGEPAFSKANGNELWVMILEKAWAKTHGSYERIIGGQAANTMRDLTGAPAFEYGSTDEGIWEKILDGEQRNFCMAAGISGQGADSEKFRELGLIDGHSYGLIAAAEVTDGDGNPVKLVKLRNPWGKTEWQGDWSDNSSKWTPELKEQLNQTEEDDGCFWMAFETMQNYFSRVQICKTHDNFHYSHKKIEQPQGKYTLFEVNVGGTGKHSFSCSQKAARMFPRGSDYEYSNCRMILMKLNNGENLNDGVTYVKGGKGFKERDAYLECDDLEAGNYFLLVEMEWSEKNQGHHEFVASCYGSSMVVFVSDESGMYQLSDVLSKAFISKKEQGLGEGTEESMAEKKAPLITKYSCSKPDDGYMYIIVKNEEDQAKYKETVNYPSFEGLSILDHDTNGYTLECGPGETKVIIIRASCGGYSYSSSYSQQVELGDSAVEEECLATGKQTERAEGIVQYFLWHSAGIMIIYKNDSAGQTLTETLKFQLKGLQIEGQENQEEVTVTVAPGEQKNIKLTPSGGDMSYATSSSYSLSG